MVGSRHAGGQVVPDVPLMLPTRLHHRPDVRQVRGPGRALRPVTLLPPQHPVPDRPLGRVVRRLDPGVEGEQLNICDSDVSDLESGATYTVDVKARKIVLHNKS